MDLRRLGVSARMSNAYVVDSHGCWRWQGAKSATGYALVRIAGRLRQVHRVTYEAAKGPIPTGLHLDHLCRTRDCINPDHLEPVTSLENTMRSPVAVCAVNARKVECKRGHPFDEENTYVTVGKRGRLERRCRTCGRNRARARYQAAA